MNKIIVSPDKISCFGDAVGAGFVTGTNSINKNAFEVSQEAYTLYASVRIIIVDDSEDFLTVLREEISEPAHILTILTECLLHSVPRDILGQRKLLIMACRSGR